MYEDSGYWKEEREVRVDFNVYIANHLRNCLILNSAIAIVVESKGRQSRDGAIDIVCLPVNTNSHARFCGCHSQIIYFVMIQ